MRQKKKGKKIAHYFTTFERGSIEILVKLGYSTRGIGKALSRHHSAVSRELNRNKKTDYHAEIAQHAYEVRRKQSKPIGKFSLELSLQIGEKLTATWSPEQIANTVALGKASFKTIYNWLY